jgi:hypothetical protein
VRVCQAEGVSKKKEIRISNLHLLVLGLLGSWLVVGAGRTIAQNRVTNFDKPLDKQQNILGDEDEQEQKQEENREEERKETENRAEEEKKVEEQQREEEKKREEEHKETEIETVNGQKIKTKIEDDGSVKVEIEQDGLKYKYESRAGEVEKSEVTELEDELGDEIEDESEEASESGIEIESDDANEVKTIRTNKVKATTEFPLAIDVATNQLIVTTQNGTKTVTILPDQAVANLLRVGLVDAVNTDATSETEIEIKAQNGEVVYEVKGTKQHRILGLFTTTTPVTAVVSAETGEVVGTQQTFLTNLIDLLSW